MLFPTARGQMDLKLWGYIHAQEAQAGTTTLDLRNKLAFGERASDAKEEDRCFQTTGLAAAEALA